MTGAAFNVFDGKKTVADLAELGLCQRVVRVIVPVGLFKQFAHVLNILLALFEVCRAGLMTVFKKFGTRLVGAIGSFLEAGPVLIRYVGVTQRFPLLLQRLYFF